jgi:hypothetical protein
VKNLFTKDEITLCTYAALFASDDFGGINSIVTLTGRSKASIQMKIQNLAAMLDEKEIPRESSISPLTGVPHGKSGRRTNWEWVQPLTGLSKVELLNGCRAILKKKRI